MSATNPLMHTLAWSLLHFLWQGAAIAAVAAAFMFVLRSPATRYLAGIAALASMLAAFAVTFDLIGNSYADYVHTESAAAPSGAAPMATPNYSAKHIVAEQGGSDAALDFVWIARGWLAGVFVFALRIAFGLLLLEHLRRRNLIALPDALVGKFRGLQRRLGIRRAIRYCECHMLRVPAVIGFLRPVVLLPMRALTGLSTEQLEAVVAHELGHIKRFDVAVNFVQVIAETLFFFHPAVWWLNKRIRADREDCCDDVAVAACGGTVSYARALATMEGWRDVPNFAMAATGSPVAARVARLLGVSQYSIGTRTAGVVTATLVLATALLAGAVSIGVANPAVAQVAGEAMEPASVEQLADVAADVATGGTADTAVDRVRAETRRIEVDSDQAQAEADRLEAESARAEAEADRVAAEIESAEDAQEALEAEEAKDAFEAEEADEPLRDEKAQRMEQPAKPPRAPAPPREPQAPRAAKPPVAPASAPTALAAPAAPAAPARGASYINEMNAAGFKDIDVDQLVALKSQDVTPEYIREIRSTGLDPDLNVLIAMKIHGVTPLYVKDIRAMGFKPDASDLVAMKIHDITPAYVKGMRELGIDGDAHDVIALKVQDVTPEYVRQMRAAGFNPNTQELISMKVQDVTPEYRKALEVAGYKLSVSELIEAKVMDITPEFVKEASAHGFRNLSMAKLIQLKIAEVF